MDIFNKKRGHAKEHGVEFSLLYEDIQWPSHCPVLGIELNYERHRGRISTNLPNSPSFDRIDPNKGYVKGNVMIISNKANMIKSNATVEELEKVASFYRQLVPHVGGSDVQEASRVVHAAVA